MSKLNLFYNRYFFLNEGRGYVCNNNNDDDDDDDDGDNNNDDDDDDDCSERIHFLIYEIGTRVPIMVYNCR